MRKHPGGNEFGYAPAREGWEGLPAREVWYGDKFAIGPIAVRDVKPGFEIIYV